jgi:hypothetical protein
MSHQKQLALIIAIEELTRGFPPDHQAQNSVAVVATLLLGARMLTAVSGHPQGDPEGMH